MSNHPHPKETCRICSESHRTDDLVAAELVPGPIAELIRREHPEFGADGWICRRDLARYRAQFDEKILAEEKGELTNLEEEVIRDLREQDILAANVDETFDRAEGFGARLADRVAEVGGSWGFVLGFFGFLLVWIGINAVVLLGRPFDPYPFILLNLLLSCLAAIQAPIIMMSQNRQEAKDRLRAEHDYQVNLKAELEVRLLSERVDRLLSHQWRRLLEIQQIQLELMEELEHRRGPRGGGGAAGGGRAGG